MKRSLVPIFGAALVIAVMLLACSRPDFRAFSDPVMTTEAMQVELERLHEINLTVANGDFDPTFYPVLVGIDLRNGKMLIEKFICLDVCPDVGMVFLVYQNVNSVEECADAVVGTPLISPEPIPGQYWGCRPIVDWLNIPEQSPS